MVSQQRTGATSYCLLEEITEEVIEASRDASRMHGGRSFLTYQLHLKGKKIIQLIEK